jgi:microcin C transport system substrate-binding protein
LAEAGWRADPETGLLRQGEQVFTITFLTRSPSSDPFLNIYKEDLRDVGIDLRIERKDWAAWMKDMDQYNFDMTWAAWGADARKDPEPMWLSSEADRPQSDNITGFKLASVDDLIARQRTEFDVNARHALVRQIDALVHGQYPYVLLWNINYTRLLYWNRLGTPRTVLDKYNNESAALEYWWYDEDSAADLTDAQASGSPLPAPAAEVRFQ